LMLWTFRGGPSRPAAGGLAVMPCAYTGFHLKPIGFFGGNPALDMPPSPPAACYHH